MEHRIFGKKLGRNHNQRKALFNSLMRGMLTYGKIQTTQAKAKAIVADIEKISSVIMTKSDLIARRELFKYLQDRNWVNRVITSFKDVFAGQVSNFTKMKLIKRRQGDDALIVELAFVKPISFQVVKKEEPVKEEKEKKVVKKEVKVKKVKKETK